MEELEFGETIDALRTELAAAVKRAQEADIQFPVEGVQLEFNVGITRTGEGRAGLKFWVVELSAGGSYASESIQRVTVTLGTPVDRTGAPVKVGRGSDYKP